MLFGVLFVCAILAFALSAICGGGASLMLIPVLGWLLPISHIPAALSIGTFSSSVSRILIFFRKIRWDIVRWFVPVALPTVWLGAWMLKFVNPVYLELAMGIFLVGNLPFVFKKYKKDQAVKKPSEVLLLLIGAAAGFLSGLTGAVGLVFNRFYLRYGLTNEQIVATRAANEIILHLIKIVLYSFFGLISGKVILAGTTIAVAALLSTWAMKWILPRISFTGFRKIGYSAMVASGFAVLAQSGKNILTENQGRISFYPVSNGIDSRLQWQDVVYKLDFEYDEGFEFERTIPITELSAEQQKWVLSHRDDADKVVIEVVYQIGKKTYEAYYLKNNQIVKKIAFK